MKKFRQIAFILMLALSLTTFAACGKKNTDMNDGSNNNSVTENGTDKNGTNDNNVVDDNTVTDNKIKHVYTTGIRYPKIWERLS